MIEFVLVHDAFDRLIAQSWRALLVLTLIRQEESGAHHVLVRRRVVVFVIQVANDAVDAERPGEPQQVGQVPEGAAEQDRPAEGSVHGAPDGRRSVRIFARLCWGETGELKRRNNWTRPGSDPVLTRSGPGPDRRSAYPLILVGVFQPQVVGQRSHSDGQLPDLLQLYRPLMGADNEGVHPPIRRLGNRNGPKTNSIV